MCLLITDSKELKRPILAFVLRYVTDRNKKVLSLLAHEPMEESTSYPGYYEDTNWGWPPVIKVGCTISRGIFHTIVDGTIAADSLISNDWGASYTSPENVLYSLGVFLIEIPPQKIIYTGLHIDCSEHLDFQKGVGCRYYKIVTQINPYQLHKLSTGGFFYYHPDYGSRSFINRVLIQYPNKYAEFCSVAQLKRETSLDAAQILSTVLSDSSLFYARFKKIYNREAQDE